MNTKVIDFSNGENNLSPLMIQPNFKIRDEIVSVTYKTPKGVPTFYVQVGCQGLNMNADTIKNAIQEINGIAYEPVPTEVIIEKGKVAKTSSPKLKDTAGNWFIGGNNTAFDKATHEIKTIDIKQKRKYFSKNERGWNYKDHPFTFRGGYDLSKMDVDKIKTTLSKIEEYFNGTPVKSVEPKS